MKNLNDFIEIVAISLLISLGLILGVAFLDLLSS